MTIRTLAHVALTPLVLFVLTAITLGFFVPGVEYAAIPPGIALGWLTRHH